MDEDKKQQLTDIIIDIIRANNGDDITMIDLDMIEWYADIISSIYTG